MEHWISLSKTSKDKIIEIFDELERANEDIVLDASDIRQLLDASCAGQRFVKTSVNIIAKASRVILNTLLMQEAEVRSLQLVDAKITLPAICYETTYKLEAYEKTKYNVIVTVFAPVNIVVAPDIGATQLCKYLRHPGDECALAFKNVDFSKLHSFGAFFHDMMLGDLVMDNCDISNIDDMSDMFLGCFALENVRINNFNIAERNGKKINMEYFLGSNSPVNPYKRESCLKHVDLGDLTPEIIEESIKPVIDWPLDFEVDDINKMLKASETTKKYLIDKWRQDRDSKDIRNGSIVKKGFTNLPYSLTIRQDICKLAKFRVAEIIECKILQYETVVQLALLSTENVTCRINNILQRTPDQDQLEYKDVEVGKYAPTFFDRYMINGGVKALMKVPPLFIFDSSALEDYLITKVVYSQAYIVEKVELIISNQFDIEQLINIDLAQGATYLAKIGVNTDLLRFTRREFNNTPEYKKRLYGLHALFSTEVCSKYLTFGTILESMRQRVLKFMATCGQDCSDLLSEIDSIADELAQISNKVNALNNEIVARVYEFFKDAIEKKGLDTWLKQYTKGLANYSRQRTKCPCCFGIVEAGICTCCKRKIL